MRLSEYWPAPGRRHSFRVPFSIGCKELSLELLIMRDWPIVCRKEKPAIYSVEFPKRLFLNFLLNDKWCFYYKSKNPRIRWVFLNNQFKVSSIFSISIPRRTDLGLSGKYISISCSCLIRFLL